MSTTRCEDRYGSGIQMQDGALGRIAYRVYYSPLRTSTHKSRLHVRPLTSPRGVTVRAHGYAYAATARRWRRDQAGASCKPRPWRPPHAPLGSPCRVSSRISSSCARSRQSDRARGRYSACRREMKNAGRGREFRLVPAQPAARPGMPEGRKSRAVAVAATPQVTFLVRCRQ
jgi:hypothetical protein